MGAHAVRPFSQIPEFRTTDSDLNPFRPALRACGRPTLVSREKTGHSCYSAFIPPKAGIPKRHPQSSNRVISVTLAIYGELRLDSG